MQTTVHINMLFDSDDDPNINKQEVSGARVANISATQWENEEWSSFIGAIAEETYSNSQMLVPVDTGILKDSGYINIIGTSASVGYMTTYASYVHEIMDYRHSKPTQAKYLTDALLMVMYRLVSTYGKTSIPDFDVEFTASVEGGVKLSLSKPSGKGSSWRKWVGL